MQSLPKVKAKGEADSMRILQGRKYSASEFEGYSLRVIVTLLFRGSPLRKDIYSSSTDKQEIQTDLESMLGDQAADIVIIDTATKEQDDVSAELIKEFFNEKGLG
jgi:hypothetical protein